MKNEIVKKRRVGLVRLFITVLFSTGLVSSCIAGFMTYMAVRTGVMELSPVAVPSAGRLTLFFMLLSVPSCFLAAVLSGRFALKPIHDLADGMNRLASGDFSVRINAGKLMRRYPAFVELTDSFNRMAQELDSTEMLRGDFVNNFSHEFKTPIVSIAGFAQLLRHGELPREQQQEYLEIIEEEALRLSYMATNVLSLTKVENQAILTDVLRYNLSEQLRSCILLLENKWSKKDIDLRLDFGEHYICANEELLKQVWINLLDNAVKFTPGGHVIEVRIAENDTTLAVTVRNTGSEIPPDSMDKIFNKFYQADESHSTPGNGVGLAIVKRVTELHGGSVNVESGDMNTEFVVTLPK